MHIPLAYRQEQAQSRDGKGHCREVPRDLGGHLWLQLNGHTITGRWLSGSEAPPVPERELCPREFFRGLFLFVLFMAALSPEQTLASRKSLSAIFNGLQRVGQVHVAQALSVSEGTISRLKSEEMPRFADLLTVCGLKVVPEGFRCYEPKVIDALLVLAKEKLNRMQGSAELEWEPE